MKRVVRLFCHSVVIMVVIFVWPLCRLLGVDMASALMGRVVSFLGSFLKENKVARENLKASFPGISSCEIEKIIKGMWRNLGRLSAEFVYLHKFSSSLSSRIEFVIDPKSQAIIDSGCPFILVGGHLGNWELGTLLQLKFKKPMSIVYRSFNNRFLRQMVQYQREKLHSSFIPKKLFKVRELFRALSNGGIVGFLVDQKYLKGVPVSFFGRKAFSSQAFAKLALKLNIPVIPQRVVRLSGVRFRIEMAPPIPLPSTNNLSKDVHTVLLRVNQVLEAWIREFPEQWLWAQNRWKALK